MIIKQLRIKLRRIISIGLLRFASRRRFRTVTYSQCGEDLLIVSALNLIKGNVPFTYLDIGANDPYILSNTALLYEKGGSGFLVEPNPELVKRLKVGRGDRDLVLQCGIAFSDAVEADFYIMEANVLSTFSREEAVRYEKLGHKILNKMRVPLRNVNEILEITKSLDFMNIDVEGLDEDILRNIDWKRHRPICLCVETITYETVDEPKKRNGIIDFLIAQDYMIFADTFINTIFVDKRRWSAKYSARVAL